MFGSWGRFPSGGFTSGFTNNDWLYKRRVGIPPHISGLKNISSIAKPNLALHLSWNAWPIPGVPSPTSDHTSSLGYRCGIVPIALFNLLPGTLKRKDKYLDYRQVNKDLLWFPCVSNLWTKLWHTVAASFVINYSFIPLFSSVFNKHSLSANYVWIRHCLCPLNACLCPPETPF